MPATQRRRALLLFRKMKFSTTSSSTNVDEGQLEIDKMMLHCLDCLGALQCVMGQYDNAKAKVFWGAVQTIAEIGQDATDGHMDRRHPGAIQLLRAFPNDQKATDGRSWLPLHWAAVTDNVDVGDVRKIARADPMATTKGCNQPISANPGHLICAVRNPNMEVVRCLFNFYPRMSSSRDNGGDLPIHYAARYSESIDLIQYLLQANPASTKITGEGELVPLHCAIYNESKNSVAMSKCLLKADASAACVLNADGDTALHTAAVQECHIDLVDALISTYPDAVKVQNDVEQMPLHAASGSKNTCRIVKRLLLEYPEAARTSARGFLPAHIAAEHGSRCVLQHILDAYPDAVKKGYEEDSDNTPLIRAVGSANYDTAKYICEAYPSAVDITNVEGRHAMHFAAEGESPEMLELILEASPKSLEFADVEGKLPLHIFCQIHQDQMYEMDPEAECLRFILKHAPHTAAVRDSAGNTPLNLVDPENTYVRRLLLIADPSQGEEELRMVNYNIKRMGIFLAFSAINADGIPNVFCELRTKDLHLLQHVLSYL